MTEVVPLEVDSARPIGFGRLLRSELRKSIDTRAGRWTIVMTVLFAAAVMLLQVVALTTEGLPVRLGTMLQSTPYTTGVLLPVVGILLVTGEWSQRTAVVTFVVEPRRGRVLLAKALAGVVIALVVAALVLLVAVVCNLLAALLSGDPASWDLGGVSLPGYAVVQVVSMLSGFALAALLLNSAAAVVVFFVYSLVLPPVFGLSSFLLDWVRELRPWTDFAASREGLLTWSLEGEEWAHLATSGGLWLLLPLVLGVVRVLRAEVK